MLDPLCNVFLLYVFVFVQMALPNDTIVWPVIYDCGISLA